MGRDALSRFLTTAQVNGLHSSRGAVGPIDWNGQITFPSDSAPPRGRAWSDQLMRMPHRAAAPSAHGDVAVLRWQSHAEPSDGRGRLFARACRRPTVRMAMPANGMLGGRTARKYRVRIFW